MNSPPLTTLPLLICVLCQALIVTGQIFLKHAVSGAEVHPPREIADVNPTDAVAGPRHRPILNFALGIVCMTLWFFLWLGLLGKWDLSKLFPFEGLNPALMAVAAWLFLKERLSISAWLGLGLICAGIVVVSTS